MFQNPTLQDFLAKERVHLLFEETSETIIITRIHGKWHIQRCSTEWLTDHGSAYLRKATGRTSFHGEWKSLKNFFTENDRSHIWEYSNKLNLSMGTAWKVLWNDLKWKAFKPYIAQLLKSFLRSTNLPESLHMIFGWRFQSCGLNKWYGQTRNGLCKDHLHIRKMTDTRHQHTGVRWSNARKSTAKRTVDIVLK